MAFLSTFSLFAICLVMVDSKTFSTTSVESPLLVGAFNIQNLGSSKFSNITIMEIVKKIILRYDLILIQEIVTTEEALMENLVKDLNKYYGLKNSKYVMKISERLGRGSAKEQYAFLYRDSKLKFIAGHAYPDKKDDFMRPPYIVHFATPSLRDMDSMVFIGIHTQPKNAGNETSSLADVYDYAVKTFKTKDAMIMGDMNAGCGNVPISKWDQIELWQRKEFTWLITHDLDTTLSLNCCPYDRIVIAGDNVENAVIWDSVNIFKYRDIYGLSTDMALAVSDHWPVEVKLKGRSSEVAKNSIKPTLCLSINDERPKTLPTQIQNQKKTFGFTIETNEIASELYTESADDDDVMANFQKLQAKYPQFITTEVLETLTYKVEHGALKDSTSYDDIEEPLYSILVHYNSDAETVTVHYCTATSIN